MSATMNPIIEIEAYAGEHVGHTAERMVEALKANHTARFIKCSFNDITLIADRMTTAAELVAEYDRISKERYEAYQASPQGIAARRKAAQEVEQLQAKADELMARLPLLRFDDDAALLDWFCELEDPRDRTGVKVDVEAIRAEFAKHGFEPNMNCGDEFKADDQHIFASWLIGQALSMPYVPMTSHFAKQWKEKFGAKATKEPL